jgi:hypothetical protein
MQHCKEAPLRASLDRRGPGATLAQSIPVRETFEGKTVWEGVVHVFDLAGHPTATRAYAWSSPTEGTMPQEIRRLPVRHRVPEGKFRTRSVPQCDFVSSGTCRLFVLWSGQLEGIAAVSCCRYARPEADRCWVPV